MYSWWGSAAIPLDIWQHAGLSWDFEVFVRVLKEQTTHAHRCHVGLYEVLLVAVVGNIGLLEGGDVRDDQLQAIPADVCRICWQQFIQPSHNQPTPHPCMQDSRIPKSEASHAHPSHDEPAAHAYFVLHLFRFSLVLS